MHEKWVSENRIFSVLPNGALKRHGLELVLTNTKNIYFTTFAIERAIEDKPEKIVAAKDAAKDTQRFSYN